MNTIPPLLPLTGVTEHMDLITAYAESAAGPGWANSPIWVIWKDDNGKIRRDAIQPEEQNITIRKLYHVYESIHRFFLHESALAFDKAKCSSRYKKSNLNKRCIPIATSIVYCDGVPLFNIIFVDGDSHIHTLVLQETDESCDMTDHIRLLIESEISLLESVNELEWVKKLESVMNVGVKFFDN